MTCSGHLEDRIGVRLTVMTGAAIMTSGVYLTSFSIRVSVLLTIVTYGFMFGLGTALAYAPPLGVAMRWFPRKKGLVNGVIVGGFGLGAFVFNQIQSTYLNPGNEKLDADGYFSDDKILNRVPSCFLLLGSIYGVIQMMAVLLINPPPANLESGMVPLVRHATDEDEDDLTNDEDDELLADSSLSSGAVSPRGSTAATPVSGSAVNLGEPPETDNIKPGTVIKSTEFWILWATFFLNTQAITYINSMYKAYGQTFISDDHFLAFVGAFAAVFNAGGRIFWGHLCDNFGYRACMMIITAAIASLYASLYFIQDGGKALFATWIWGIFFAFCANFVLLPTASAQCFGTKYDFINTVLFFVLVVLGLFCRTRRCHFVCFLSSPFSVRL